MSWKNDVAFVMTAEHAEIVSQVLAAEGHSVYVGGAYTQLGPVQQRYLARLRLEKSDAELNAMWSLLQGGHELFSLPRAAAFRTFVLGHIVHHRGQLSVYLRLNDIAVPPIYGPSADSSKTRTS